MNLTEMCHEGVVQHPALVLLLSCYLAYLASTYAWSSVSRKFEDCN
jgi:hypothetical protein